MINIFDNIKEASNVLKNIIKKTPVFQSEVFSTELNNEIFIKPENLQLTGSFKIRGAYYKIHKLSEKQKKQGLIASSAGNHAQGVAYSSMRNKVQATIVMPEPTPLIKIEATRKYGADVVLHGNYYDQAFEEAKRLEKKHGFAFIHPFDDLNVIAGQGTIGLEILAELSDADIILVPVGGGGLISGIAAAIKNINPKTAVIGVEPQGAAAMKASLDTGSVVELDHINTIADGVAVKKPGDLTFEYIKKYVDDMITVSDYSLMESFLILLERHKIVAENAAVLSLAAIKNLNVKNKKIVSVVSGGNIDVVSISAMINRGLISRGRILCFSVELPDKPGELLKISQILAEQKANIIKLDHNQFKTIDRFMQVHLEVTVETNGHNHIKEVITAMQNSGYTPERIY